MATFAEQMMEKYQTLLLANAGLKSVSVDGMSMSYDDLEQKYFMWKKTYDIEQGNRTLNTRIDLSQVTND